MSQYTRRFRGPRPDLSSFNGEGEYLPAGRALVCPRSCSAGMQRLPQTLMRFCSNLIATSTWIALKFETASAIGEAIESHAKRCHWLIRRERPLHLSFCVLLLSGLFWSALRRWGLSLNYGDTLARHSDHTYSKLQFGVSNRQCSGRPKMSKFICHSLDACSPYETSSALLVACVVLRAILLRSIILDVQCSWNGIKVWSCLTHKRARKQDWPAADISSFSPLDFRISHETQPLKPTIPNQINV